MKLTVENCSFIFERDNGTTLALTPNEVSFIVNQSNKIGLRDSIEYWLREMDEDSIDLNKCPYGFNSLVDEIFTDLEDEVDFGNMPDDDDIQDKIIDVCSYYDMCID